MCSERGYLVDVHLRHLSDDEKTFGICESRQYKEVYDCIVQCTLDMMPVCTQACMRRYV